MLYFFVHFIFRVIPVLRKSLVGSREGCSRVGARGLREEAWKERVGRRLQPNAKVTFIFKVLRYVFEGRYHELSIFTTNNHKPAKLRSCQRSALLPILALILTIGDHGGDQTNDR